MKMEDKERKLDNLERQILMYQSKGYDCITKDEKTASAIMERKGKQNILAHLVVLLFLGWWLLFIPNIILYFHYAKTKVITVFG